MYKNNYTHTHWKWVTQFTHSTIGVDSSDTFAVDGDGGDESDDEEGEEEEDKVVEAGRDTSEAHLIASGCISRRKRSRVLSDSKNRLDSVCC